MSSTGMEREKAMIARDWLRGIERACGDAAMRLSALIDDDDVEAASPGVALRGPWQRKIARLPGLAQEPGMSGGEVAREAAYDEANTYTVLAGLQRAGLVEEIAGVSPKRWRLTTEYRRDRILRASRVVLPGEWTTYGDIAIAVNGNVNSARSIGRVAAKHPAFSNPHRVLKSGGRIDAHWSDDDGNGADECERRLVAEGVSFENGSASPAGYIRWEEIKKRLGGVGDDPTVTT